MDKYDKILTQLLTKFYTDESVEQPVRNIVKGTVNAEITKLDRANVRGIMQEIRGIIEKEAELKQKHNK